jgi:hypothetical protein
MEDVNDILEVISISQNPTQSHLLVVSNCDRFISWLLIEGDIS